MSPRSKERAAIRAEADRDLAKAKVLSGDLREGREAAAAAVREHLQRLDDELADAREKFIAERARTHRAHEKLRELHAAMNEVSRLTAVNREMTAEERKCFDEAKAVVFVSIGRIDFELAGDQGIGSKAS